MTDASSDSNSGTAVDAGSEHIAGVYAKALLAAASKAGQTEEVLADLDSLVDEVLKPNPGLEAVLGSALINPEEKTGIVDRIFASQASPLMLSFLKVLAAHGRLDALRAIRQVAHQQHTKSQGHVQVFVSTAIPVDASVTARINAHLHSMLGRQPEVEYQVDPNLLGGIVLKVGDTVYDGSVFSQLERLRAQMIDRSIHEIQSRRDRVRNSTGDRVVSLPD